MKRSAKLLFGGAAALLGCSHGAGPAAGTDDAAAVPLAEAAEAAPPPQDDASGGSSAPAPQAEPRPPEPKTYKVVVHTGDSMVGGGLCKALAPKFKAEGTRFIRDVWESASLMAFAESDRLPKLMKKYDPDLVLLTLGANDVFDRHPENLIRTIESIVKKVGERDCYWVGPPLWKGDFGLNEVIRQHASPCRFFDSSYLVMQRAGDGIHPTDKGGVTWADAFWHAFNADRTAPALLSPGVPTN